MTQRGTPADLASAVLGDLAKSDVPVPSEIQVCEVFETLFDVSLRTEEGEAIACHIIFFYPDHPHVHQPVARPHNRWSFTAFGAPIPFTESDLSKLAKATEPRSSAIAVFPDDNGVLEMIGLVDQGSSYLGYINHEQNRGIPAPGVFQAIIEGTGQIAAYVGLERIGEISASTLRGRQVPVFQRGPIHETLMRAIDEYALTQVLNRVEQRYGVAVVPEPQTWIGFWFSVLCRLLLRIRSYRHGGALLLTSAFGEDHLRVKYPLHYERLREAIPKFMFQNLVQDFERRLMVLNEIGSEGGEPYYPKNLTLNALGAGDQIPETEREINDTLWFIANLTRVDGLVFMDPYLAVHGFGAEIRVEVDPPLLYQASDAEASIDELQQIDPARYGMRHRSMMRWTWVYPQSVGFVVSQDGHVRAVKRHGDAVVMWDNVLLQRAVNPPLPSTMTELKSMTYEELAEQLRQDQEKRSRASESGKEG